MNHRIPLLLACLSCMGCGEVVSDPPERQHWVTKLGAPGGDAAGSPMIEGTDILVTLYSNNEQTLAGSKLGTGGGLVRLDSSGRLQSAKSLPSPGGLTRVPGGDWLFIGDESDAGVKAHPFVRRLDPSWKQLWSWGEHLGPTGNVSNAAADAQGNVYVLSEHDYDMALTTKLDTSGTQIWEHAATGFHSYPISVDLAGNLTYLQVHPVNSPGSQVVVRRDPKGEISFQVERQFQDIKEVVTDDFGRTFVVSECTSEENPFDPDMCLWSFDANGGELWQQRLHDPALGFEHQGTSVRGERLLLAVVPTLTPPPEENRIGQGLVLFELDTNTGEVRLRREIATAGAKFVRAPVLLDGDVVLSGSFDGQVDFGVGTLDSDTGGDVFVAKLPWDSP